MTQQLRVVISVAFTLCICLTNSFGQTTANVTFEQARGTFIVPLTSYKEMVDIQVRKESSKPCYRYDQTDSSLTFVTDSAYEVKSAYDGVVKVLFEMDGNYTFGTKFGDYFII